LADRLMKGPLPPAEVLKYGIEICEGLERAHRSWVLHRDLKPSNIMLTKTGAKLMDSVWRRRWRQRNHRLRG
jgi:eukaryotic-like serine/threonine-protein kinase